MRAEHALVVIKIVHTLIWAVMASSIIAIPIVSMRRQFRVAAWLSVLVLIECIVLAVNGGRCPLTGLAAGYTTSRAPDFDIYLPLWLAEHNKTIFGWLFVAGEFVWLWKWLRSRTAA